MGLGWRGREGIGGGGGSEGIGGGRSGWGWGGGVVRVLVGAGVDGAGVEG